jgi:hypothetical protein
MTCWPRRTRCSTPSPAATPPRNSTTRPVSRCEGTPQSGGPRTLRAAMARHTRLPMRRLQPRAGWLGWPPAHPIPLAALSVMSAAGWATTAPVAALTPHPDAAALVVSIRLFISSVNCLHFTLQQESIDELTGLGFVCDESGCVLVLPAESTDDDGELRGVKHARAERGTHACIGRRALLRMNHEQQPRPPCRGGPG